MDKVSALSEQDVARLSSTIEKLMPSDRLFEERLDKDKMISTAIAIFAEEIPEDKRQPLETINEEDLENILRDVMVLEAISGTLNDLTPEQTATFDKAVRGMGNGEWRIGNGGMGNGK